MLVSPAQVRGSTQIFGNYLRASPSTRGDMFMLHYEQNFYRSINLSSTQNNPQGRQLYW
jgi:hypothetical protein